MSDVVKTGGGRVWTTRWRSGPDRTPYYHGYGVAGAPDWPQGDVTKIEAPSDTQTNQWEIIGEYQASADRATVPLTTRKTSERSELEALRRLRCPCDVEVHFGTCEDPRDYDYGWDKIEVFPASYITGYTETELGAMEGPDQSVIDEEATFSAREMYTILRMHFSEVAKSLVSEEIVAVKVCDNIQCGDCASPSDGCSRVFAVSNPAGSSPGILPQVIVTEDAFATSIESIITTFDIGENATDAACVGIYLVVISEDGEALHYAETQNLIDADETWTEVTTGFVAGNGPLAIWSYSALNTWIVGENGYIYFSDDPTSSVTVQDAGSTTTENLNDVEGVNTRVVVAVGDANTVVYTLDGETWQSVTGPDVSGAPALIAVGLRNEGEWWVGTDDGKVYYTTDKGERWTEKVMKGTPTQIDKIYWASEKVGFISIRQAGPAGKILRTISGGKTWYILPEQRGQNIPANDYITDMDGCQKEVNILFAGGLSDGGSDGILLKVSD